MADLYMLGKVSKKERPFFDYEYYFMINQIDEGDEKDYVVFIKGGNMLENTISMWDLIDPEKRKPYFHLRYEVIEQESNELDWGPYLITLDQVKQFLEILDNLDVKLEKFIGSDKKVLPEYVDFVSRRSASQTFDDGSFNYDGIKHKIQEIQFIKGFLQQAIELNYPLATSG